MAIKTVSPNVHDLIVELERDPLTGERRRRSVRFYGTKREAKVAYTQLEAQAANGVLDAATAPFAAMVDSWFAFVKAQGRLSPTTAKEYDRIIEKRIKPGLGKIPVRKLTARHLDAFYVALSGLGLSASSVHQAHAIIRSSLQQAQRWGVVPFNVAKNASPPTRHKTKVTVPTGPAVATLIAAAKERHPDYGMAVHLAAATGARRGELCALRWSDVDLERGVVRIARSYYRVGKIAGEKDTKTHAERTVDVDAGTVEALRLRLEEMDARFHSAAPNESLSRQAFILSLNLDGLEPMIPARLTDFWRRLCRAQGVGALKLHSLRHWSVSEALDQGWPAAAVAERHGHASTKMTLDVYGHGRDGRGRQIAEGIGKALGAG